MSTNQTINGRIHRLQRMCYCGDYFFPTRSNQRWCPRHQFASEHKRKEIREQLFSKEGSE